MRSYSELNVFDVSDVGAFRLAVILVTHISDSEKVRCHELARAIARSLNGSTSKGFTVVDGHYGAVEHSWIMTENKAILDVYAVGSLPQVQLIHPTTPGLKLNYRPGKPRTDIDEECIRRLLT